MSLSNWAWHALTCSTGGSAGHLPHKLQESHGRNARKGVEKVIEETLGLSSKPSCKSLVLGVIKELQFITALCNHGDDYQRVPTDFHGKTWDRIESE